MQSVECCDIGIHVAWWFAAPNNPSSTLGISPNAIPPPWPHSLTGVPLPVSMCPHCSTPTMSENIKCSVSCSFVSLPRMVVSRFIYVPTKDTNSSFLMAA